MPSNDFERVTLIHDGKSAEIREATIALDGDAAKVYADTAAAPQWETEGMDIVIGDADGNLLFAGKVLSIDLRQKSVQSNYTRVYRCLSD